LFCSLDESVFDHFPGKGLVGMSAIEAAIQEMFQAPHFQVSWLSTINLANYGSFLLF
jgi:hypothetical protein